jgi:hypothetical protein
MFTFWGGAKEGSKALSAGFAIKAIVEQGGDQARVAFEELAVVAGDCQRTQRPTLGAARFQLQRNARGGDDLFSGCASPQAEPTQHQGVDARVHLGQYRCQCVVIDAGLRAATVSTLGKCCSTV